MWKTEDILSKPTKVAITMIKDNLQNSDQWCIRGLLAIFARQTSDEQASEFTKHNNSVGFNGLDGQIMSSFAKQVLIWQKSAEKRFACPLSPKQMAILRKKITKYAGQLLTVAIENQAKKEKSASISWGIQQTVVGENAVFSVHSNAPVVSIV